MLFTIYYEYITVVNNCCLHLTWTVLPMIFLMCKFKIDVNMRLISIHIKCEKHMLANISSYLLYQHAWLWRNIFVCLFIYEADICDISITEN